MRKNICECYYWNDKAITLFGRIARAAGSNISSELCVTTETRLLYASLKDRGVYVYNRLRLKIYHELLFTTFSSRVEAERKARCEAEYQAEGEAE